jgi:hypothetical protein
MQDDCRSSRSMEIYHLTCCMTKSHSTDVSFGPFFVLSRLFKKNDHVF